MKARIPKHREFIINLAEDYEKKDECWDKLQEIMEAYKKEGKSVYTPTFIEDNEDKVKALQKQYEFTYTIEERLRCNLSCGAGKEHTMEFFAGIGAGWMNLASLALGLLAWMLPVAAMIRTAARPRALHPALPLVCVSFAACAAALYLQLRYHAHLSRIEDVGAFLDTAQAAAFASAVLLCVTLALNALALCAAAVCARKAADRA